MLVVAYSVAVTNDDSGMDLFHGSGSSYAEVGRMMVGHHISSKMIVMPSADWIVRGVCSSKCTGLAELTEATQVCCTHFCSVVVLLCVPINRISQGISGGRLASKELETLHALCVFPIIENDASVRFVNSCVNTQLFGKYVVGFASRLVTYNLCSHFCGVDSRSLSAD